MLIQSLSLALLAFLIGGLPLLALLGDPLLAARWASVPAALALGFGCWSQVRVMRVSVQREINRLNWRVAPSPIVDQPVAQIAEKQPIAAPSSTPAAPRGFVFNAGGKSAYMALEPAAPDLVAFLDVCIKLSAASKKVFPSTRDLDIAGYNFARYHQHIALLEGAIEKRKNLPPVVSHGWTLGDLRKMAAGDDLPR